MAAAKAAAQKSITANQSFENYYNDLLKDYVLNIKSIKKLNIFDFTYKKLDTYSENNLCIIKDNDEASDIRFNNA